MNREVCDKVQKSDKSLSTATSTMIKQATEQR